MNNEVSEKVDIIDEILRNNNLWASAYAHHTLPVVCVAIERGDWKHDHWACDAILEEAGYVKMGETVTLDDGSDVYSSIHYFV